MKIYDCFMYNNEDLILEIRLNYLDEYVEKFIIVESKFDHQGNQKKKIF
jgi:beta-1,4-mannosyl-glycoprotein beta-1,4-N-acetylglucosaminyltransferase